MKTALASLLLAAAPAFAADGHTLGQSGTVSQGARDGRTNASNTGGSPGGGGDSAAAGTPRSTVNGTTPGAGASSTYHSEDEDGPSTPNSSNSNTTPATGSAVLSRDYIGTELIPCPWGETRIGDCKYQGKLMKEAYPPPSPSGFVEKPLIEMPGFPTAMNRGKIIHLGGGRKWAMKFKGTAFGPFVVAFGSLATSTLVSPMEMFVSISRQKGGFNVPPGCLVTPASMVNPGAGGADHSMAKIEVRWSNQVTASDAEWARRGQLCILEPGGDYYLNVAGDCSSYWDPNRVWDGWQNGCPTNLGNVNGWFQHTSHGAATNVQ